MVLQVVATVFLGIIALIFSSDIAVGRSIKIAKKLGISDLIIGLTVVSIGTSLPEIFLSLMSGIYRLKGFESSGIAVGNIIGSCLSQITIILGLSGMVAKLHVPVRSLKRDGTMMFLAILLMYGVAFDGVITSLEGIGLTFIYITYLYYLSREERTIKEVGERKDQSLIFDSLFLLGALLVVVLSSSIVVREGLELASVLGISPFMIGIFAGIGTSLPELSISIGALGKGAKGLTLGNLIGSNITDPLLSLGMGAAVAGFTVEISAMGFDFVYWIFSSIVAMLLLWNHVDLNKKESSVLILVFLMYMYLKTLGV